jgi:hypothetical protein
VGLVLGKILCCGVAVCGLALASGCGPAGGTTLKATGTLTYKGQPVKSAVVTFTPTKGRSARAETDAQGKFVLSTFASGDGAVPGEHKVTITSAAGSPPMPGTPEAANYRPEPLSFPAKYTTAQKSDLTVTVEKGKANDFSLDLED